jgi:hypothetical protein
MGDLFSHNNPFLGFFIVKNDVGEEALCFPSMC